MQITFENILWIIGVLAVAGLVVYTVYSYAPRLIMNKDYTVTDMNVYIESNLRWARFFFTIKNTGNVPITEVKVELYEGGTRRIYGWSNIPDINGGESRSVNDWRLQSSGNLYAGKVYTVRVMVRFIDGDWKSKVMQVVLQPY